MPAVDAAPSDLDASRAAIAERGLVAAAAVHLTTEIATQLPFESLTQFKGLLKRFFSTETWSADDRETLSRLVTSAVLEGWWDHELDGGLHLMHGIRAGEYVLYASGAITSSGSIFTRAFTGPVIPEPTPHPRKVKFSFKGDPAPGLWVRRGDADRPEGARLEALFAEPDVTDVMIAGDFVTIGLAATSSWQDRLESLLDLVTGLFGDAGPARNYSGRTRDELLQEAGSVELGTIDVDLHLLDPADPAHRARLMEALGSNDARDRRIAVALLAEADDPSVRQEAILRGFADRSRRVKRTAVDAAGDTSDPRLRSFLERAAEDPDRWIRWRATRALGVIGAGDSATVLQQLTTDPDFRVRFEAEKVLRRPKDEPLTHNGE
jgi:hypothetical protein